MKIDQVLSDKIRLASNFNQLMQARSLIIQPQQNLSTLLSSMPTAHSFGFEQQVLSKGSPSFHYSIYPYQKILLQDKALLSDSIRAKKNRDFRVRKMTKARNYGLHEYIFCHLGSHEYYYSQYAGSPVPAFGVFLSSNLDATNQANATLYDLESRLVGNLPPEDITLDVKDARMYTAHEIAQYCNNDFFTYWICQNYVQKEYCDTNTWEHKREFHYYEEVGADNIMAVIWPVELEFDTDLSSFVPRQNIAAEIIQFQRHHKNIPVYQYEWNEPEGQKRFAYASFLVTNSLYKNGTFLQEDDFVTEFLKKFPGW